jgi:MSHA biogenesis protein MshQ
VYASVLAAPIAPSDIVLRASTATAPTVTSSDATGGYEKARPRILSGRLRVANGFGRVGTAVTLEIATDYWSGYSWLPNVDDNVTRIPAGAFAQTAATKSGTGMAPSANRLTQTVAIKAGKAEPKLTLSGDRAGWIDLAINLGAGVDTADIACAGSHPPSTGATLPWLRLAKGCRDPAGRATFGEQAPENRRIIHVREVFN